MSSYRKIAQFKSVESLRSRIAELGCDLPIDPEILTEDSGSPMREPTQLGGKRIGNRWCIHPMEGWDGTADGKPTDFTRERWKKFGLSGAKLIWGGEAVAVRADGRANSKQLVFNASNVDAIAELRQCLAETHREHYSTTEDLCIGVQLTHSGRFARPNGPQLEPKIAYHHPLLDEKFAIDPTDESVVWADEELDQLVEDYVQAAVLAEQAGFDFVDIKACHGYLLHEFLSARLRSGRYGGDLAGRSHLLLSIVDRVRDEAPQMEIGVRLSLFDIPPYATSCAIGQPMNYQAWLPYQFGFGNRPEDPMERDLTETFWLVEQLAKLGVAAVNATCGSPYYNPHIQRPAIFPPSDGYQPPEDPILGVCRQIAAAVELKAAFPNVLVVGSGYSYLQDYLPHVAQAIVRNKMVDVVGLGRMVLSYPTLPADTLSKGMMTRKQLCRTFSDCTTAPRIGLVSGCYPLDANYKKLDAFETLTQFKREQLR